MEENPKTKFEIRKDIDMIVDSLAESEIANKTIAIEKRLFEFANFIESNIVLLYFDGKKAKVRTREIVQKCYHYNKIVVLPAFDSETYTMTLMKVDNPDKDMIVNAQGMSEPNPQRCRVVPVEVLDIALIPGIAFDEKGGRIGSGEGYYDRLIPQLSATTRKVALCFESQMIQQIQMESHDKYVDIIITEERIIYKI